MPETYDAVIIGAGPAGLAAGLYCPQAKLKVVGLDQQTPGGKIMDIERIENYPGYSNGISGPELGGEMLAQAISYGMELQLVDAEAVEKGEEEHLVRTTGGDFSAKTLMLTGGARPKRLGVSGEEAFIGKGVGYCALCEGGQFSGKDILICGGGDAGLTDALYLSKIATHITVVEVQEELQSLPLLKDRIARTPNIDVLCCTRIKSIGGDTQVRDVELVENYTGESRRLSVEGVLIRIGWEPETEYLKDVVPLDDRGFVLVNQSMETAVPGIFAAGDMRNGSLMQVSTAVGDGTAAALSAQEYLQKRS